MVLAGTDSLTSADMVVEVPVSFELAMVGLLIASLCCVSSPGRPRKLSVLVSRRCESRLTLFSPGA
jgi:hypothetical protein